MRKKQEIDIEYYENTDFGDYMREADKKGLLIVSLPGENVFDAIKRRDAMLKARAAEKKAAVNVRLPVGVANKAKEQAAAAGIPWTVYVRNIVERAVTKPRAKTQRSAAVALN